jgi:hypothetical protein
MTRKRIWVSPDEGKWKVKTEGAQRAAKIYDNKEDAVQKAIGMAKGEKPSQVIIQKQDGKIQEERTYGDDPYPPKG